MEPSTGEKDGVIPPAISVFLYLTNFSTVFYASEQGVVMWYLIIFKHIGFCGISGIYTESPYSPGCQDIWSISTIKNDNSKTHDTIKWSEGE